MVEGYSPNPHSPEFYDSGTLREIHDHCAVAGIIGPDVQYAGRYAYKMAESLQHRGQESSGIVLSNSDWFYPHKKLGLVHDAYNQGNVLNGIPADSAIVQNRYGTFSTGSAEDHMQPVYDEERQFTLVHNGNIANTKKLDDTLAHFGISYENLNDTERIHAVMSYYIKNGASLEDAMARVLPLADGAASLLAMSRDKLVAARDEHGIRPLALGKLGENVVFASETHALDEIGATYLREVKPGEMIIADRRGIGSIQECQIITDKNNDVPRERLDIMEFFYFAHPQSILYGNRVLDVRKRLGAQLFSEMPREGTRVTGVPNSAIPAAKAFAEAAGLEYVDAITKNKYDKRTGERIMRTFISANPEEAAREAYTINADLIRGMDLVVPDDSLVRGTTQRVLNKLLWEAKPKSIHNRIVSPPFRYPEVHGLDVPDQRRLIAHGNSVESIRQLIGATSLGFLSPEGAVQAIGKTLADFSTGPFTGEYPTDIGEDKRRRIDFNYYYFYNDLYAGPQRRPR